MLDLELPSGVSPKSGRLPLMVAIEALISSRSSRKDLRLEKATGVFVVEPDSGPTVEGVMRGAVAGRSLSRDRSIALTRSEI